MARGKVQIRRIENATTRQVTYSKRKQGLFKKAHELSVLCDAKVSVILISSKGKANVYHSDGITTKQIFDRYQKDLKINLWSGPYQDMLENLKEHRSRNEELRLRIRQRTGECLDCMSFEELFNLEQDIRKARNTIHEQRCKVINKDIDTLMKKKRSRDAGMYPQKPGNTVYDGLVDNGEDYKYYVDFRSTAAAQLFELQLPLGGLAGTAESVVTML